MKDAFLVKKVGIYSGSGGRFHCSESADVSTFRGDHQAFHARAALRFARGVENYVPNLAYGAQPVGVFQ
jgi:hypothetical protein